MLAQRRRQRTTDSGQRTRDRRRGVTLVEMLVTVAVLVIMMTILVQIFQAATGSVSAAQAYQAIDDQLRRLDGMIRSDLEGATARFTPPLDPAQNLGYFEYGENEFADNQGEDGDDYIRFTAKAPAGRPFTGRVFIPPSPAMLAAVTNNVITQAQLQNYLNSQPVTITSDYAEIIYFVRNGNLYRRVFLVAPELQPAIAPAVGNTVVMANGGTTTVTPTLFGQQVSWLGVNDLSAHPAPTGPNINSPPAPLTQAQSTMVLNTLGNLTNRENRAFYPRFANDFFNADPASGSAASTAASQPDGIPDDTNLDNVPDLYPSLYPGVLAPANGGSGPPANSVSGGSNYLVFEPNPIGTRPGVGFLGFPYVFPGAYSKAQVVSSDAYGWIHAPAPYAVDTAGNYYQFDTAPLAYLQNLNHNPLDLGDNLPTPPKNVAVGNVNVPETQSWWGFPTWRETLAPLWNDPTVQVNVGPVFVANGISPQTPMGLTYASLSVNSGVLSNPGGDQNLLPPMASTWIVNGNTVSIPGFRNQDQLFCDGAGGSSAFMPQTLWPLSWEDDLIMTGVRSFDVKAYDNALANYADLGWADDLRLYLPYQGVLTAAVMPSTPPMIAGTPLSWPWPPVNPSSVPTTPQFATLQTFMHEGRMPPMINDNRLDYQYPNPTYLSPTSFTPQYSAAPAYSSNVGDDNNGIVRLRRVWDSWSTDYSRAPGTGVNKMTTASGVSGFPVGPPFTPPIYPSYPPPYPAPLRGIQIQVRVVDPSNQRIKSLTIRQDFTDKL